MQDIPQQQNIRRFLEDLYEKYRIPLLRIVRKYIGASNACEDVFHEVFIRIIKNAEKLYLFSEPKLEAYIFLVARGVSFDYLRKHYRHKQVDVADDDLLDHLIQQEQQELNALNAFDKIHLAEMVKSLPAEDQLLLIGKYYLGLDVNELVVITGGTPTAVRSKLHRAKKKAFQEWSQAGLSMEDFLE